MLKIVFYLAFFSFIINQHHIDRKSYYEVLSGQSLEKIEQKIAFLEKAGKSSIHNAYLGGLYMKKASFLTKPKEKIDTFNKGKELLETEIKLFPNNTEYRFIRLILQEHAPQFLKYNSNIEEDKIVIVKMYSTLDKELQIIIQDYTKTSAILTPELFR